jgi:hypothetical protein
VHARGALGCQAGGEERRQRCKGSQGYGCARRERLQQVEKHKSSSMSTVYLSSTITVPDVDRILLAMATLLHKMIIEGGLGPPSKRTSPTRLRRSPRLS